MEKLVLGHRKSYQLFATNTGPFLPSILALFVILSVGPGHIPKGFAQNAVDDKYITASLDIHNTSQLLSTPAAFARGETIDFYGYVDGYAQLENDSNAIFNVTISGPEQIQVFNQEFVAEEIRGQDVITFKFKIPENASFGLYEITFTVSKSGHKYLTPEITDPLVGMHLSRFYVFWTNDEIIDETGKYRLTLISPSNQSSPLQFGSSAEIEATLCPSPGYNLSYLSNPDNINSIKSHVHPIDEEQVASVVRSNSIPFSSDDTCSEPFLISDTGVLGASGRWSVNATAEWTDGNHAYRVRSDDAIFYVGGSLFRTDNIVGIDLDDDKYSFAVPMDWSADGRSVLFRYTGSEGAQKLAILPLEEASGQMIIHEKAIMDFGNLTVMNDSVDPEVYVYLEFARFGQGLAGNSIYFGLDQSVFKYDLSNKSSTSTLTISSAERLSGVKFLEDVLPDGRIAFVDGDSLMLSFSDGQDPEKIANVNDLHSFDFSSDGKKLLFTRILDSGYGYTDAEIGYTDLETGTARVVPNMKISCGSATWAPNDYNIIIWDDSCWRAPGAGLAISDINGSFKEYIVPGSDDNPTGLVSPDGKYMLIGFNSYSDQQARDYLGPHSDFYLMTLARPLPEFSQIALLMASGAGFVTVMLICRALLLKARY